MGGRSFSEGLEKSPFKKENKRYDGYAIDHEYPEVKPTRKLTDSEKEKKEKKQDNLLKGNPETVGDDAPTTLHYQWDTDSTRRRVGELDAYMKKRKVDR